MTITETTLAIAATAEAYPQLRLLKFAGKMFISLPALYSHLQKFKTRHDFQAFLSYDVRLFNFMFLLHHPVWVENEYNERKRTL